ncbi:MAG TPA: hypothetical protein VF435_16335 [Pyrinomonadaceae bacterium]
MRIDFWRIDDLKFIVIGVASVALLMLVATSAFGQASTQTTNIFVPIEDSLGPGGLLGHPCGTGDVIQLTGNFHVVIHTTRDDHGGLHRVITLNDQGLHGVGLVSGTDYRLIRNSNTVTQETNGAEVFIFVRNQRLIAKDPLLDFFFHQLTHMTFNANGELTSVKVVFEASCEIIS